MVADQPREDGAAEVVKVLGLPFEKSNNMLVIQP